MSTGRRQALISVLFALTVALIGCEIIYAHYRSEPYPGLFQPSFGSVPLDASTETELEPQVTVIELDGSRRIVSYRSLLPPTGVIESAVFQSAFYNPARAEAPQTKVWLRSRLEISQGNDDATALIIQWQRVRYSLTTRKKSVQAEDRRIVVDLRGTA